ncbi:helix-turn-helix domain-containing protein [Nocardioides ultimimeridianus]
MHEEHAELLRALDPATLGARVRAARVARGLTQAQLGGDGISTGYVSRIESGARRPTLSVLATLASRLDTSLDHLLRGISGDEYDEIRLTLDYAELALETGELSDAESQARSALADARRTRQVTQQNRAAYLLGRAVEAQGRLTEAVAIFEELERTAAGLTLAECGIALVRCYKDLGDLTLAIETGERIERHLRDSGLPDCDESVRLAVTIAGAFVFRGDLNRAAALCAAALEAADRLDSPMAKAGAYWNASLARARAGATVEAIEMAERALALLGEGSDARNVARLRTEVGRMLLCTADGDVAVALGHAQRAQRELTQTSASALEIAMADYVIAQAHLVAGDLTAAVDAAERALLATPADAPLQRAEILVVLGRAMAGTTGHDEANRLFHAAADLLRELPPTDDTARAWTDLAAEFEAVGEVGAALDAYRSATDIAGLTSLRPVLRVGERRTGRAPDSAAAALRR